MRREYFDLHVSDTDWVSTEDDPRKPTLVIEFDGPSEVLEARLAGSSGTLVDADETDVNCRAHANSSRRHAPTSNAPPTTTANIASPSVSTATNVSATRNPRFWSTTTKATSCASIV